LNKLISDKFTVEGASLQEQIPEIDKIDRVFGKKSIKEIVQALEALGNDEWAMNTLKTLRSVSPLSLRVVHRQLTLGKHMSFKEVFYMEKGIAHQMLVRNDD
jgi:SOS-response transcriptional repressor LexA